MVPRNILHILGVPWFQGIFCHLPGRLKASTQVGAIRHLCRWVRFAVINYQKNNSKYFTYSTVTCTTQVPEILESVYLSLPDYRLLHAMVCSYQNRHIKTNMTDEDNCLFNC